MSNVESTSSLSFSLSCAISTFFHVFLSSSQYLVRKFKQRGKIRKDWINFNFRIFWSFSKHTWLFLSMLKRKIENGEKLLRSTVSFREVSKCLNALLPVLTIQLSEQVSYSAAVGLVFAQRSCLVTRVRGIIITTEKSWQIKMIIQLCNIQLE